MGKTIAFSNQKGGTGKTTTVINTAGALTELGKKVLVVDADPQGNATLGLGVNNHDLDATLYDVMVNGHPLVEIIKSVGEGLDLAPTNITLSLAEGDLINEYRREDRLRNAIEPVKKRYDYIFIDCPPALGMLTVNALSAADSVIIPMETSFYSLVGLTQLIETIDKITSAINPDLHIEGILPTRFVGRTNQAREVLDEVKTKLGGHIKVFDSIIRELVVFREAPVSGLPVTQYNPRHEGTNEFRAFAKELVAQTS